MITLCNKYRLRRIDKHNIVVEIWVPPIKIPVGDMKGQMSQPRWDIEGYFGRLDHALSYIMSHITLEENVETSFEEILKKLEECKEEIRQISI